MNKRWSAAAVVCALAVSSSACGDDDSGSSASTSSGGASTGAASTSGSDKSPVKFTFIADTTSVGALYGKGVIDGAKFNVDKINKAGGVNGHPLEMSVVDSASDQAQAVAAMTKAARGDSVATLYGVLGQNALAMGPIAQREKMPLIISFSSVDEITKPGDYLYRTSTSEGHYYDGMVKYFVEQKKMKSMAVWFASDNATAVGNASKTMPALAKKYNVKITGTVSVKSTDTDFSSTAAKIAGQKPDAVAVLILGAGVNTAITALRRAGYKGALFGSTALGAGALKASGQNSKNTFYPASILASPEVPWASGQKFLEDYKAATGSDASAFTAAGNDQVQFLANAVKSIKGDVTKESVHDALKTTAAAGFSGATGDPVKFDENRNAVTPGLLIEWDGSKEVFAANQASPLLEEYAGQ